MNKSMLFDTLDIVLRSTVSVIILFILAKIMGKKQISQLTFFDYITGISIGSVAASLADESVSYFHGIVSLVIFAAFPIIVSFITIKSIKARRFLEDTPAILVQNGKIVEKNLKKSHYQINDLLEVLRVKGAFNVQDIEFAILEPNGEISVLKKSQKQPVTPSDINISTQYQGLQANLIIDGKIMRNNLKHVNLDED